MKNSNNNTPTFVLEVVAGQVSAKEAGIVVGAKTYKNELMQNEFIQIIRGESPLPGIDPLNGGWFYIKPYEDDTITFSTPIQDGEYIKINTL